MTRRSVRVGAFAFSFLLAVLAVLVYAGDKDFWAAKPYTDWSEKEVKKLLENSPWAKTIPLSVAPRMGGGGPGGDTADATGGGERRGGGSGGSGELSAAQPAATPQMIVRWYARPVREALAREILLTNPETPKERIDKLLQFNSPYYSVLIFGWTGGGGRGGARGGPQQEALQQLRDECYLHKKNKEKVSVAEIVPPKQRGEALVLRFPKEKDGRQTLTLDDKEVELDIKVRDNTYHIRFKFADMVVKSQLEL